MDWKSLLTAESEYVFAVTGDLFELVDDDELDWKPATGDNWMTTGQLLQHITSTSGGGFKGFVTGDWGMPEGSTSPRCRTRTCFRPAEKMPTVGQRRRGAGAARRRPRAGRRDARRGRRGRLVNKVRRALGADQAVNLGRHLLQSIRLSRRTRASSSTTSSCRASPSTPGTSGACSLRREDQPLSLDASHATAASLRGWPGDTAASAHRSRRT